MHETDDGSGASPVSSSQTMDEHIPPVLDLSLDIFQDRPDEGDQLLLHKPFALKKKTN